MRPFRKWLYIHAFNLVSRLAPADVRAVHREVFSRGFKAYEDARKIDVLMREDLRAATNKSCPTRLMDGRNEIRCWLPAGHEGDCK